MILGGMKSSPSQASLSISRSSSQSMSSQPPSSKVPHEACISPPAHPPQGREGRKDAVKGGERRGAGKERERAKDSFKKGKEEGDGQESERRREREREREREWQRKTSRSGQSEKGEATMIG